VYETAGNGSPHDGCYDAALALNIVPPTPRFAVQGSVWNVGAILGDGNEYGVDGVGFTKASVDWYRQNLQPSQLPCTATTSQSMMIVNNLPGYGNQQLATHTLTVTIGASNVTVSKDGQNSTLPY
jgi:hypothetical protein